MPQMIIMILSASDRDSDLLYDHFTLTLTVTPHRDRLGVSAGPGRRAGEH